VSALTFAIYFVALGFVLGELTPITVGQYLASATVIGLAVGFGTQGLVQDVVTGLTLIFSDALDIGTVVEVSGQVGRIEKIGLRFTTLTNFVGQTVYIPNRNIAVIGRYRVGYARVYLDVQLPDGLDEAAAGAEIDRIARAFRAQHPAVIVGEPRTHPVQHAGDTGWRYIRTRFRIWPGQQTLIETALRQRTIAAMRELDPAFADWMVTVTYRIL
jgi:moderate conductance mechanosensitive channel